MRAPAVVARRAVSCTARVARARGQLGAAVRGVSGGAGRVRPASASLAAQAGPACVIRIASRARVPWVTVTVTKPAPVTSAWAIHGSVASWPARRGAGVRGAGRRGGGGGAGTGAQAGREGGGVAARHRTRAEQGVVSAGAGCPQDRLPQPGRH